MEATSVLEREQGPEQRRPVLALRGRAEAVRPPLTLPGLARRAVLRLVAVLQAVPLQAA